ncbi:O-methyltransferase [Actinomadura viridis]|uniref:Caffeoyl-CoA O-methyltransferase n=1 Tax=Actinomadura viridis TaxID=58110 RepID=A0A931DP33_9ACTN|nr:O-methyltransferase [Actinomadura viridis]MBG6092184.1 caffeoyl-CoA O-methyltransferase [Actinomadura viridis]
MTRRSGRLTPELHDYIVAHGTGPDDLLRELAAETAERFGDSAGMQIGPEQGTFMTLLARVAGARDAVEVGTFTGYSSICLARGIRGRMLCCDVSEEWTSVARRYWERAGLSDRIELRLGPALETLRGLPGDTRFDLAFIDADKGGYVGYWEELVPRVRPGGVLLADNTLWSYEVADESRQDEAVRAIRAFNGHAARDARVELVILPIGDGLTMARRLE